MKAEHLWKARAFLTLAETLALLLVPIYVEVYAGVHRSLLGSFYRACLEGCGYWEMSAAFEFNEWYTAVPQVLGVFACCTAGLNSSLRTRVALGSGSPVPRGVRSEAGVAAVAFLAFGVWQDVVNPLLNSLYHGATIGAFVGAWAAIPLAALHVTLSFGARPFLARDFRAQAGGSRGTSGGRGKRPGELEVHREKLDKYREKLEKHGRRLEGARRDLAILDAVDTAVLSSDEREAHAKKRHAAAKKVGKESAKLREYGGKLERESAKLSE
ncbi:MAG: hypothetical protein ACTSU5_18385 [Promethearchaeota archaeon]